MMVFSFFPTCCNSWSEMASVQKLVCLCISCVILSRTRMKFTAFLPRWVSTENVNQSPANNNPRKQAFCLCKNQALAMKTVIAILLLILCIIQRLSTKTPISHPPIGRHVLCCLPLLMLINVASGFIYGRNPPISSTYLSRMSEIHCQETKATAVIMNSVHFRKVFLA